MYKKIFKNLWVKIFCLLLAVSLWVYVAAGQNSVGKFPGSINIKAVNVPSGLVAIYDAKTVDIKIMAEPATWRKLSSDSFSAYVDLSPYSEGTYEVNVIVASTEPGVQIVEKSPEKIFVNLEPLITKNVDVNSKIEGSAGEGLTVGGITFDPVKIQARGPKSLINSLAEAFATIKLSGEVADFTKVVSPEALDEKGENIPGIDFLPSEVTAKISIVKSSNNKTVGIKVKTTGAPQSGYFISAISVNPVSVDVTGPKSVVDQAKYIETLPIDITGASKTVEKDVSLDVQNGIILQAGAPSKVHVKITFSDSSITKELVPTISIKNLSGYIVKGYSTNQIKVTVAGTSAQINNLQPSGIILTLDFADKSLGDSVNFDISNSDVSTPDGTSITSILPSSITAFLEKK